MEGGIPEMAAGPWSEMMRKASFLGAALTFLAGSGWAQNPTAPASPVSVVQVEKATITATVPVTGTVYSRNDVQITIGVDGQLEFVAEPGSRLERGDVVARIDTVPLELQKAEQQAQAQRARAQLRFLNAQLKRQRDLLSTNATSANQMEQTQSDRDVAASDLEIAELRSRQIEDQLRRGVIAAQFDGVVVERFRREGEDVSRGTVVARMTDTENLEVRVYAPLRYSGKVQVSDTLRIYGYETEYAGTVRTVVPSADMRSQTFELRIDLPTTARADWSIGQLVSIGIPLSAAHASLAVPRDALILRQDGTYVFRINAGQVAERVKVVTGESAGDLVAIQGTLAEGDVVVVRGAETLSDGQIVSILNRQGVSADAIASGG